jgi:hypothetical protein
MIQVAYVQTCYLLVQQKPPARISAYKSGSYEEFHLIYNITQCVKNDGHVRGKVALIFRIEEAK